MHLTVHFLNRAPENFPVPDEGVELSIGRDTENIVVLDDPKSSRRHARIIRCGDSIAVEDLKSTNGIFLNGRKVGRAPLSPHDEVLVGATRIVLHPSSTVSGLIEDFHLNGPAGEGHSLSSDLFLLAKKILSNGEDSGRDGTGATALADQLADSCKKLAISCENMEKSYQAMLILNRLNSSTGSVNDLKELLSVIMDMTIKLLKAERGFLMMYEKAGNRLIPSVVRRMQDELGQEEGQTISMSIADRVLKEGRSILTTDALVDPRFKEGMSVMNLNIRSAMCVPLKTLKGIIGVLYLDNRVSAHSFGSTELAFLETFAGHAAMAIEKTKLYSDLEESYLASIEVLANVLDASDPYTHGHSMRVSYYSIATARKMGLPESMITCIRYGSLLHDIGKVGIPQEIINKPGKLTDEEFEKIRKHPAKGFEIIKPIKFLEEKLAVVKFHHERYDGKGYPSGLAGSDIPVEARISAVADAFDAMTSTRSYRHALTPEKAIEELKKNSGTQFDPEVVEAFTAIGKELFDRINWDSPVKK
ncbi:MAG: HD domain-containing protein [Candidatus Wallbacteria bacterium]|nr:HD domain-containing protein [Candidatus Wallbacteria bacterium]